MNELRGMMAAWGCTLVDLAQIMGCTPLDLDAIIESADDAHISEKKALRKYLTIDLPRTIQRDRISRALTKLKANSQPVLANEASPDAICSPTPGYELRIQRKKLGLTQVEMATRIGCSDATICFLEQDKLTRSKFLVRYSEELKKLTATIPFEIE